MEAVTVSPKYQSLFPDRFASVCAFGLENGYR
jgi:hypothetical protein